jgi:prepilin signal peptidase PulO-like enzyme (type II secretory pathway)
MTMDGFLIVGGLSVLVLLLALWLGPLPIVARGFIRGAVGPTYVHRWSPPIAFGLAMGMLLACVGMFFLDARQTTEAALLCLLFLLACIDWQWRWLPIEWTLGIIALGLIQGVANGDIVRVLMQMIVPSLALLALRQITYWVTGKEALGLGDIWLLAGLGAFLPVFGSFLLVGFAAFTGLIEVVIRNVWHRKGSLATGVSYGTHLCIVFLIFRIFPQIL